MMKLRVIGETDVYHGDCLDVMSTMATLGLQVDSVVTDPPYHLSTVKRFGKDGAAPANYGTDGLYQRASRGFMGKEWDGGDIAFDPETWRRCYDLLKPGGYLLAFSGSRTYHRMACAIEDAGFEIRDQIMWLYGTGFPKSHDVSNAACEWEGWGTALKPAHEPIVMARKPLIGTVAANLMAHGTGAINIDACRVGTETISQHGRSKDDFGFTSPEPAGRTWTGRFPANVLHDGSDEVTTGLGDAQRYFYAAKASKKDRAGSKHPTVKPASLIEYLCKLVTRPGGTVLDPFAGSGTLGSAWPRSILIEREDEYIEDIYRRLSE